MNRVEGIRSRYANMPNAAGILHASVVKDDVFFLLAEIDRLRHFERAATAMSTPDMFPTEEP